MKHIALLFCIFLALALAAPVMAQGMEPVTQDTVAPGPSIIHGVTLEPTPEPTFHPVTRETTEPTVPTPPPTREPTKEVTTPTGPEVGWVSITSTPSAASVELDGKNIGVSPDVGREVGAGISHTVRIAMEGYEPYSTSITVGAGEQASVDATLKEIPVPVPTTEPTPVPTHAPIGGGKGWIEVNANVNGATVSFDDHSAGCTIASGYCDTEVAVTGTPYRTFTIQMPGYDIYTGQVAGWPMEGETVHLYATLNPVQSFGSVLVSSYPTGAVVYLDGRTWQYTPATFTSVSANTDHTVQVSLAGYQTYTTTVYVPAGITQPVSVNLVPVYSQTGSLSVTSNPKGADIYVDGRYQGSTPAVVSGLSPGSHTVRVQKVGYDEFISTVTIYSGQRTQLPVTFSPQPANVGSIEVSSSPAGASLFLDGHYMGLTSSVDSTDLTSVRPGLHTVQLTLEDYQTYTHTVQVTAGGIVTINAQLSPVPPGPAPDTTGEIVLTSSPAGANVLLDNVFRGITPLTLADVPDGSHVVMVRMDGYSDQTLTVNVAGTAVTPVIVSLAEIVPTATKSPVGIATVLLGVFAIGALVVFRRR
jgi:hypothetical protein